MRLVIDPLKSIALVLFANTFTFTLKEGWVEIANLHGVEPRALYWLQV